MSRFDPTLSQLKALSANSCEAWVLGGGITGITTAIALQALGIRTAIVSEYVPLQTVAYKNPFVATDFAMASAYPHNLKVRNLEDISDASQQAFNCLSKVEGTGVQTYRMFEVYEQEPDEAPLASRRMNFQLFDGAPKILAQSVAAPSRPGAKYLWGWMFDTHFADMPVYLDYLWSRFVERGGVAYNLRVNFKELVEAAEGRVVFNCLGLGAVDQVGDETAAVIVRGRQVLVPGAPMVSDSTHIPIAYNYTPSADQFSRADGNPEYVHFFPRSDGWVLGQTREPGSLDANGNWIGAAVLADEVALDNCSVPRPIITLNESILSSWMGCNLSDKKLVGRTGYRYYRDPQGEGVRLESEKMNGTHVVHNYGHGGSGVTMSWGCALQSVRFAIESGMKPRRSSFNQDAFDRTLVDLSFSASNLVLAR